MKFIELFAGIGGFRLGLERASHICVWSNEIDKHAINIYNNYFGETNESTDIRTVNVQDIPDHDILAGGFPCQTFSIAGKRQGFKDTRGTLFFEICRIIKSKKPQYLFLENVKGLLNHDEGKTFKTILSSLDELGYDAEWSVCNSKDFGVPQNRERVFIIGHLRTNRGHRPQVFPIGESNKKIIKQQSRIPPQLSSTLFAGQYKIARGMTLINESLKIEIIDDLFSTKREHRSYHDTVPTLTSKSGSLKVKIYNLQQQSENRPSCLKAREQSLPVPGGSGILSKYDETYCLDTSCGQGIEIGSQIRRLTPKECYRLQGFGWKNQDGTWNDTFYEKARKVASDSQIYKTAGNAVTVNVIEVIAKRLM